MGTPKFKVDDKVKVLRASTDDEYDLWLDSWVDEMDFAIGNVYTIIRYITYGLAEGALYGKYILDDGTHCNFPEFVLQSEIQVGEQLEFDFMR
jgi:hypothetical protein